MSLDLRSFIEYLREKNELINIDKPVSVEYEIAAYIRKSCDQNGPAFLFSQIKEFPGQKIVAGLYGNKRRLNLAIGFNEQLDLSQKDDLAKYIKTFENYRKGKSSFPISEIAPVEEVIVEEKDVDLFKIPIGKYNSCDSGFFITSGIQVVYDSLNNTYGYGIHRMCRLDKNHLACLSPIERRVGGEHFRNSEKGIGTPISIFFGGPRWMLSSQAKVEFSDEKYSFAEELYQDKIILYKCDNGILVPAESEMVIEGISIPNSCIDESPFGEYTSTPSLKSNAWIVEVKRITHRKDYIMEFLLTGRYPQEDSFLCGPSIASLVYKEAKETGTQISNVSCYIGNGVFSTNVAIKKRNDAEVRNLIYKLLANKYIKIVTIVDDDLDPENEEDIRFGLETRFQPNRDLFTTDMMVGASLDPSTDEQNHTRKIAFDLTIPFGNSREEKEKNILKHQRVWVPGETQVNY